jgi:peptide chain release factor 1
MELLERLSSIYDKYVHLEEQLGDPNVINDMNRFKKINKEYKDLKRIAESFLDYRKVMGDIEQAKEMLNDEELRDMAREEIYALQPKQQVLEEEIKQLLIPKDPDDSKDVLFEIRSGTGGDEAAIFAGDLYRMYQRYFDVQGWKTEVVDETEGAIGGYSKIFMEVTGEDVFAKLKFESGAHRVQRVPETEAKGRVHTSAATVVVMPKMELEDFEINPADLRIDVYRASGAGGQHVNKTESAVRIVHLPTGVVSESQEARSQIKNREIAMNRLIQRIKAAQEAAHEQEQTTQRRSLVGSGDRSDKIRTYNFPQNRLTDHRINLTLYSLDKVMNGDLEEILEALRIADNAEKLKVDEND